MFRRLVIALALAFLPPIATSALALDANAINTAEVGNKPGKKVNGPDPLLIKAQVLLDRARFSRGDILHAHPVHVGRLARQLEIPGV